jgi:hypothetical protein
MPDFSEADLKARITSGRAAVSDVSKGLIDYLSAVKSVVETASAAAQEYQNFIGLADASLSDELGAKLRESVAQFANGSMAMATAFSQMVRTMSDAYDRVEKTMTFDVNGDGQ